MKEKEIRKPRHPLDPPTCSIIQPGKRSGQNNGEEFPMIKRLLGDDFDAAHDVAHFRRQIGLSQIEVELDALFHRPHAHRRRRVDGRRGHVVIRMLERVEQGRSGRHPPRGVKSTHAPILRRPRSYGRRRRHLHGCARRARRSGRKRREGEGDEHQRR